MTQIISDEKTREKRLISIAEAAKAENEAKTDFVSRVAHDIRTPMNSLFGFLQIAEANIDDPEKIKYSLQKIRVAGDFLKELVNDVLDISKIENGKMRLKNKNFEVKSLFEELPTSIQGSNFGKELNFNYNVHDIFCNNVIGDALRLKQIYTNILSNAIKYTPDGGNIDFEVYEKTADEPDNIILVVKVTDNGIGMSKEFMNKMFFKFERETDSRLNPVGGYGLGLSIVKQLVDMMNGKIDVKSKLNEGTTFIVEIPLIQKDTEAKAKKHHDDYKDICNGMHLLVAEDNELSREVMKELLFINGISCDFANDGTECVEMFKKAGTQKYDALLMDVQMPNMTGIDASKAIRGLNTKHSTEIPIIAMTANALTTDIKSCFDAGMNQHLSKPVDINKLLKVLAKLSGE